jgi:hypothetical protein
MKISRYVGVKPFTDVILFIAGVIPHIHKSLIGKKGSQKPA